MDPTTVLLSGPELTDLAGLIIVLNTGALYLLFRTWWRGSRRPVETWRVVGFLGGLSVIMLTTLVHASGGTSALSLHVAHHALLAFVAPPLLLLGKPVRVILRGAPPTVARFFLVDPSPGILRSISRFVLHPFLGLIGFSLVVYAWQVPFLYEAALQSSATHALQHGLWFAAGMIFWWYVIGPGEGQPRLSYEFRLGYLFAGACVAGLPGVILLLSTRVLYPSHAGQTSPFGLPPLEDQIVGGLLLLVVSKASLGIAFTIMFFRLFRRADDGPPRPARRSPRPPFDPTEPRPPSPRQPAGRR